MTTIQDIRQQYPQYNDLSDQDLADRFHNKFYSDISKDDFYNKIGLHQAPTETQAGPNSSPMSNTMFGQMSQTAPSEIWQQMVTPENVNNLIDVAAATPGMKIAGQAALKLGDAAKTLFSKIAPQKLVEGVQAAHDRLLGQAQDLYNLVKNEVVNRGVNKVNINSDLLDEAGKSLPSTRANKQLLANASNGDYEALHSLQSDLGKKGIKNLSADTYADRNMGEQMLDTRDKINEAIRNHFNEYGHPDLSSLLDQANDKYRTLKQLYYESNPTIGKMVNQDIREIPKNPMNAFSKQSKPMDQFLAAHPEVSDAVGLMKKKSDLSNTLKVAKDLGIGTGVAGGIGITGYGAYKLLSKLMDGE